MLAGQIPRMVLYIVRRRRRVVPLLPTPLHSLRTRNSSKRRKSRRGRVAVLTPTNRLRSVWLWPCIVWLLGVLGRFFWGARVELCVSFSLRLARKGIILVPIRPHHGVMRHGIVGRRHAIRSPLRTHVHGRQKVDIDVGVGHIAAR